MSEKQHFIYKRERGGYLLTFDIYTHTQTLATRSLFYSIMFKQNHENGPNIFQNVYVYWLIYEAKH